MKKGHKHKLIGQWCIKCRRYIGKFKNCKPFEYISAEDYLM